MDASFLGDMRTVGDPVLILTVFSMQCSIARSVGLQLIRPMNTVSTLGSRVKIECSSNTPFLPVDWEFASAGSRNFTYIYFNERLTDSLSSRYNIDTDNKTRYDVVINSVDLFHAGTYRCTPIAEEFNRRSSYLAELVVVGSDPICNTNASSLNGGILEGDYIRMWCIVNYSGNWIPVMEWTRSNGKTIEGNVNNSNSSTTVTSVLIEQIMANVNGIEIMCKTSFKPAYKTTSLTPKPYETLATNVIQYHQSWNFTVTVLYAPRNLNLTPVKSVYKIDDRVECSADANPAPTYKWVEIETNKTIQGPVLIIDDNMASNQIHSFRCIACNTVAGSTRQINAAITFTVNATPVSSNAATIALTIGGVCAVIVSLLLGFGVGLTVKACSKGNSARPISSGETSIQHQDRDSAAQLNVQFGNSGPPIEIDPLRSNDSSTHHQEYEIVAEFNVGYGDSENSVVSRIFDDSSIHDRDDYEIVHDCNVQFEDSKVPSVNHGSSSSKIDEVHKDENVVREGYSSLHRDTSAAFAQPSIYTKLHQYANVSSTEA